MKIIEEMDGVLSRLHNDTMEPDIVRSMLEHLLRASIHSHPS